MSKGKSRPKIDSRGGRWRAALCGTAMLAAGWASAQQFEKPFSADMVKTTKKTTETSKVYVTPTATRTEGVQDGKKFISIMRFDRHVIWSMQVEEHTYVEMPMPAGADVVQGMKEMMKDVDTKREPLGTEMVGGFLCEKTRMTVTWQGVKSSTIEWTAKELGGFAIKTLDETTGETTEYKNIRPGPQDPALFELPAGYKKLDLGGMMGRPQNEN